MIAQYYKDEKVIAIFPDHNSNKLFEIKKEERAKFGFPPFRVWRRVSWGYELEFVFNVIQSDSTE